MAYSYDPIFAVDPNSPSNVARNASILIFDPNDATKTPVTLTDITGSPITNPITVNQHGFGPAIKHATLDRLAWEGAGMSGVFTSYEGMKEEAVAARVAAQAAATTAAAEAAEGVASVVADAESAATSAAASATAAAQSAALVNAPADTAIAAAINGNGTATKAALSATYALKSEAGGASLSVADAIGEYNWNSPAALYRTTPSPRTYFGATSSTGEILACYIDHSTGKARRQVIGTSIVDDHHIPSASVPEGGAQVWAWTDHNTQSKVWFRVGDSTGDLDTLGPVRQYDAGGLASYSHLVRNPGNLNEVWLMCRTWPGSSAYNWIIVKGTINPVTKDIAWGIRYKLVEFTLNPTVQGYMTIATTAIGADYGFRFAITGNPTNGDLHTVTYGTVNLVSGAVESPGKALTANVITGAGLPLSTTALDVAFTPPTGHTTRLFAVRDGGDPAVAIATWDPANISTPTDYKHIARSSASYDGAGLVLASNGAYASLAAPPSLQSAQNYSVRAQVKYTDTSGTKTIARRYSTDGAHVFQFTRLVSGVLRATVYPAGTVAGSTTVDSSVAMTYTPGDVIHVRLDVNAVGSIVFYTSPDGTTWTQLGAARTFPAATLSTQSTPLVVGAVTNGIIGSVGSIKVLSTDGATTHVDHSFKLNGQGAWTLTGAASIDPSIVAGWTAVDLGEAGQSFSMQTGSRYTGGLAYPTPSKGDLLYACRENAGTWTLEKISNASGAWVTRVLDTSTDVLARPMPIANQGPLETLYSVITDYVNYQDFESSYRGI